MFFSAAAHDAYTCPSVSTLEEAGRELLLDDKIITAMNIHPPND